MVFYTKKIDLGNLELWLLVVYLMITWVNIKCSHRSISDQTWMPELKFKYWTDFTEEVPWNCNRMHTAQTNCVDLLKNQFNLLKVQKRMKNLGKEGIN